MNIAYVTVPRDLSRVKEKLLFNLTKRQLICFGGALLIGLPVFFLLRGHIGNSAAAMCMIIIMMPFMLLALYEKNGQPLEKILGDFIRYAIKRPKKRPYIINNAYDALQRQYNLEKEVFRIVHKKETVQNRKKADNTGHSAGKVV